MTILSRNVIGGDIQFVVVDASPTTTQYDAPEGSLIIHIPEADYAKPVYYYKVDDGLSSHVVPLINPDDWDATTPPTVTDDATRGKNPGSEWYDTVAQKLYKCVDSTPGAAVWREI